MLYRGGFFAELCKQLEGLDLDHLNRINKAGGLEVSSLLGYIKSPPENTVSGLEAVREENIVDIKDCSKSFSEGSENLTKGKTAHCIWADDDSFEPFKGSYIPVLESQILRISSFVKKVWLICSPGKIEHVENFLNKMRIKNVEIFPAYETFYFSPEGTLDIKNGTPNFTNHGSGDALEILYRSGRLEKFLSEGGKSVIIASANNMVGGIRSALVGNHNLSNYPVTCEIVPRKRGEAYGALAHYGGFDQIIEPFRFLSDDEEDVLKYSSTETYVINCDLDFSNFPWTWNRVRENIDNKLLIKHQRSLSSLTNHFKTMYVLDERDRHHISIKDYVNFLNETRKAPTK